jgi:nucleotide-binding universal stress UspA family protein
MAMYRNLLVPTDGSPRSKKAAQAAAALAARLGAQMTGAYVIPPYEPAMLVDGVGFMPGVTGARQRAAAKLYGQRALAAMERIASAEGVRFGSALLAAATPWEGILKAAKAKRCDLIVMASHGRRGLAGLLLGSETAKVLTHSKIPVLVCR